LNQTTFFITRHEWVLVQSGVANSVSNLGVVPHPPLLMIQDQIREDFGWSLAADLSSIHSLLLELKDFNNPEWSEIMRSNHLQKIKERLVEVDRVVVIGAAVEAKELESLLNDDSVIIAADGAVGVFSELIDPQEGWSRLVALVSDADGFPYLDEAINRRIPVFLHAHGDNMAEWKEMLKKCNRSSSPLLLTHQCPDVLEGAINPGGFTDGDRAIALAIHLGVEKKRISLCGFTTKKIGRWSGQTIPENKMRKLRWMSVVIEHTGVKWGEVDGF